MNLKEKAKKATEKKMHESEITKGRNKIKLEELIASRGNNLHICGVDILQVKEGNDYREAAAMIVTEDPDNWTFGGASLFSIVNEWQDPGSPEAEPISIDAINAELKVSPIEFNISKQQQKKDPRKSFWKYEVV